MNYKLALKDDEFQLINEILEENFGISFPEYKKYMLESKLKPRVIELGLKTFMDYYIHLQFSMNYEKRIVAQLLTNNESYFFRETYQVDALLNNGIEDVKKISEDGKIKFLIAGCSSGEEAYTLNIMLLENKYKLLQYDWEIFAIDIDMECLIKAKKAEYTNHSLRAIDEVTIQKYFFKNEGNFKLKTIYKNNVFFEYGNIIDINSYQKNSPYSVIFCRNVLIYFSEQALFKAIKNFARVLKKGGFLFLGHSESIIGLSDYFEPMRMGDCIVYKKVKE